MAFPLVTVGALITGPSERILLIQSHKWRDAWCVPGGKIDYAESMEDALKREFREETGLEIFDIQPAPTLEAIESEEFYKPQHFILLNFLARSEHERVVLNDEAEAFVWLAPERALDYQLNSFTRKLVAYYLRQRVQTSKEASCLPHS